MKVNGYRIELGEVEAMLSTCSIVEQAVVLVRLGQLAAYLKPTGGGVLSRDQMMQIRDHVSRSLTSYMVPR